MAQHDSADVGGVYVCVCFLNDHIGNSAFVHLSPKQIQNGIFEKWGARTEIWTWVCRLVWKYKHVDRGGVHGRSQRN